MGTFIQVEICTYFFTKLLKNMYWVLPMAEMFTAPAHKNRSNLLSRSVHSRERKWSRPEKATWCRRCRDKCRAGCRPGDGVRILFVTLSRELKTVRAVSRENHAPGRASPQRPVHGHLCALDGRQRPTAQSRWGPWAAEALREHTGTPASHGSPIRNHTAEEWHDLNPVSEQAVWLLSEQTAAGPWVNKPETNSEMGVQGGWWLGLGR